MKCPTPSYSFLGLLVLAAAPACHGAESVAFVPDALGGAGGSDPAGVAGSATAGAAGSQSGGCGVLDPELASADAADLFDYPHVPTFDFYLPPDRWAALQRNAADEQYAEVEACFEGRGLGMVGLRFKGSYGSLYECAGSVGVGTCRKLSMKVKFSEYDPEQRFFGLKRLNFNANRFDDSRIKERLAYDMFRAMGIVAPRAAWAVLRINGESQGLYGMVEQVDGRFTADRWPDNPDGNLYKEAWPDNADSGYITTSLRTNEDEPDVGAFVAFAEDMSAASEGEVRSALARHTDVDYLARFLAVEDAIASYDGITYFWTDGTSVGNHNYYFYEEAADRFTIIPWDVESTFWINSGHSAPHWTEPPGDCTLTYEYWGGLARAPGCDRVIQAIAADLGSWRAAGLELLDGPFAEATVLESIDRWAEFVREAAEADPTPSSYGDFEGGVTTVRNAVPALRRRLEQLLAGP
ncbi:MAG: CotH kinase family protein [Polyangiaceae bacterium]|nr:CotH kinase family protein [Polyangiaceae bacterium]